MLNVLILDPEQCSSFLVKSILIGAGYAVSVSADEREASRKIATGLFDAAVVDLSGSFETGSDFIRATNDLLPELPVIALHREENPPNLEGLKIYLAVTKPIRVARITEALRRAARSVSHPQSLRPTRAAVAFPAEVQWGLDFLACRVTSLSERGLLLEARDHEFTQLRRFDEFFGYLSNDEIRVRVRLGSAGQARLVGRIAFVERTPDQRVRRVGVIYTEVLPVDVGLMKSYIALMGADG